MDAAFSAETDAAVLARFFLENGEGLSGAVRAVLGVRAEVQEVLQDAYLKALRALREGQRPRDLAAWVFVLTLNLARDHLRKGLRRGPVSSFDEVTAMSLVSSERAPSADLEEREAVAAARVAIHDLRDQERDVFLLRVSGGLSFEAIGLALEIPVGTAKTRMRLALCRLREKLAEFSQNGVDRRSS